MSFEMEKKGSGRTGFLAHFLTITLFVCIAFTSPILLACYFVVRIFKKLWMKLLASKFPYMTFVESDSIRTLLDTHRNQGVINVLMTVKGTCQPSLIQQALLEHVIEKKDRSGNWRFPKLRAVLVSCWGNYAWIMSSQIEMENHLIQGNPKFRGRPITDQNLQEYVSDVVSKYLPKNAPPWQIIIIPNIQCFEPKYGILIRVHHLLLEEEGDLNIGDFMLLKPEEDVYISPCHSPSSDEPIDTEKMKAKNPLSDILHTPKALPSLYNRLSDSFSNRWNEFIADYDPIESPKMLQKHPGIFDCAAILLITLVSACKEFRKYINQNHIDSATYVTYFISILHREAIRRGLTSGRFFISWFVTFNPVSIILKTIKLLIWMNVSMTLRISLMIYEEYKAFRSCIKHQYCTYPNTVVAFLYNYLPLLYAASKETFYICNLIYRAPMTLIHELFFRDGENKEEHQLQTMSTCGRKVVAWSQPVSRKWIREISLSENVSETEVLLAMTTCCIKEYFNSADLSIPEVVLATARSVTCDTLLASLQNNGCCNHHKRYGMVYLTLPVGDSCSDNGRNELLAIAAEMKRVSESQGALYALSGWRSYITQAVPSVFSRVALNYGSRKYSVALTEVAEGSFNRNGTVRSTRWGHAVSSLICWRPPQGNISMSLTIHSYAGSVRLGVMADALMSPQHQAPARYWPRAAQRFHTLVTQRSQIHNREQS